MQTELYQAIKGVDLKKLTGDDKEELLGLFMITKHPGIRNCSALIFADLGYNEAIPSIIKKIKDKNLFGWNGTLVYALESLDSVNYFVAIVRMVCEQDYEARLMAYNIVEKHVNSISAETRKKALKILKKYQIEQEAKIDMDQYENSTLHFIDATKRLLLS